MADWMQSAMLTIHGHFPEDSHRRFLRKGRSNDEPFDQILATGAQDDGGSIAFTSSKKPSRLSQRGRTGGRSHAHPYAVTTEDPTLAYIKQHHDIHLQQHLYDSDGGLADCWGAFRRALIGCCTSQRKLERDMVKADQRYREMKRRQEVERQKEVERKMALTDEKMHRRLDAVVRRYELESTLKKQRERQLHKIKEMVRQEWAKTVGPQTWCLIEEEVKELNRLRKEEVDLHLKIQRLRHKEAMSICTVSEEDERGQLQRELQREKEKHSHLKQQHLETKVCETLSEPQKCVCATAVDSRLSLLLNEEEMELLQRVRNQQDSLLLRIKALEDRETKAKSKTHKLSLEGTRWQTVAGNSETSQQKMGSIKMAQHREGMVQADRIAQLEKESVMERQRQQERLRELDEEWSRRMERLKEMKQKEEMMEVEKEWFERQRALKKINRMENERERDVRKEIDKKHYELEMRLKNMERNLAKERDMDLKKYEERVRELQSKCQQDLEAKMLEMEHKLEKEREMSQKVEEEILRHIEHQQHAKMDTLKHIEKKVEKERQRHLDMEQELERTQVESQNRGSESERKTETEREMQEQLDKMKQDFEKEREVVRQRHENRWREIEEKNQQEWEERTSELEARREVARQQELELLKLREEQKKAKEEECVKELKQTEKETEGPKTSVEETHRNTKLEKAKAWMTEIKQNVQTKERVREYETENGGKVAKVEERKPGTEGLDWLRDFRQKGEKNKDDISQHKGQLTMEDTSKDVFLLDALICKHEQRKTNAEQKHEDLADDWLGDGKDKWSEIRRKHQRIREESQESLRKQLDQGQQTETNNCTVVRRKGRRGARETDAEEQTVTEENKQGRKDVMNLQNEGLDSLGGLQQKVRKGRRACLQEVQQVTNGEDQTEKQKKENKNNNNSLTLCSTHFTVSKTEVMLKENHQREITQLVRLKRPREVYQPKVQPTGNQCSKPLRGKSHIQSNMDQTTAPVPDPTLHGISMNTVSSEMKLAAEREESLQQERRREEQERARERLRIERERETEMKEITVGAERTTTKTKNEEREEAQTSKMKEKDDESQVCSDVFQGPSNLADDMEEELAGTCQDAEAESGAKKDKSVRRRVFAWANKRVKNYYKMKIERTHVREAEEGDNDYHPWYLEFPITRAEREQQKREKLLKAESRRQKMEDSWLKWQAKKAEKKDKTRAKEQAKMEKRMARLQEKEQKLNGTTCLSTSFGKRLIKSVFNDASWCVCSLK